MNYSARHIFGRGYLTRVQTIHFARWVFLDDKRRMLFCSNYDGSLESYMDDFINKVAWGLNLVFSQRRRLPARPSFLIKGGAEQEDKFKRFLRNRQQPTDVWYKAYPGLTAFDLAENGRIREGLEHRPSRRAGDAATGCQAVSDGEELMAAIDFADMQGLLRFGHGKLKAAEFLLLEVADAAAARAWLRRGAGDDRGDTSTAPPRTALQVAFTAAGLRALGVEADIVAGFPQPFLAGMAGEESRSRRLGDVGAERSGGLAVGPARSRSCC